MALLIDPQEHKLGSSTHTCVHPYTNTYTYHACAHVEGMERLGPLALKDVALRDKSCEDAKGGGHHNVD